MCSTRIHIRSADSKSIIRLFECKMYQVGLCVEIGEVSRAEYGRYADYLYND